MRWNRSFKLLRPYIDWQYKLLIDRAVCDGFWIIEFLVANKFGGDRIGKLLVDRSIRKGISRFAKAMRAARARPAGDVERTTIEGRAEAVSRAARAPDVKGRCFRVHVASARSRTVWVFAVAIRRERGGHPGDGYRMTGGSQRMASRVGSFEAGQACGRRRAGCRARPDGPRMRASAGTERHIRLLGGTAIERKRREGVSPPSGRTCLVVRRVLRVPGAHGGNPRTRRDAVSTLEVPRHVALIGKARVGGGGRQRFAFHQ